jgi:hypothetical protein
MSFWEKLFGGLKSAAAPYDPTAAQRAQSLAGRDRASGAAGMTVPTGDNVDELLPWKVGPYSRGPIPTLANKGMPIYSEYQNGAATVFVELGICDNAAEAQAALETARGETGAELPDPSQAVIERGGATCVKTVNRLGAFIAWTRGSYYFSAHAKGGENHLEEFMTAFPY